MAPDGRGQSPKRRHHRKSRTGCLQCKQRHVKCDEHRPACVNCTTTSRKCSYLDLLPAAHPGSSPGLVPLVSPSPAGSAPDSGPSTSYVTTPVHSSSDGATGRSPTAAAVLLAQPASLPLFDMRHLILVHHLDTVVMRDPITIAGTGDDHEFSFVSETIFRSAKAAPYLLVEALAFSATHLSTLQTDQNERAETLQTSEELQTRALGLFNQAQACVTEDNYLPMFLFSSIIGMHALFNAVATAARPGDFLSQFVQYIRIHRGVRTITGQSWHHIIRNTYIRRIVDRLDSVQAGPHAPDDESDRLAELLSRSRITLSEGQYAICAETVQMLQSISKQHRSLPKHVRPHAAISWPIRVSAEYIDLLEQRQPIALLILTYWAILLHRDRDFWVFNTAGQSLITSVGEYLGSYWDEWLAIPREALAANS